MNQPSTAVGAHLPTPDRACSHAATGPARRGTAPATAPGAGAADGTGVGAGAVLRRRLPQRASGHGVCAAPHGDAGEDLAQPVNAVPVGDSCEVR
ncbi:hypothetical protein [Streptomyces sp. NBC_01497]|uniref:hypothetical protein n=1 Tax=Streptomyces sp. NBC_01497 TaxID=2903885 RepID=UPI002E3488AB|nr:hypothetical protein [Streptomyces sp. NBC_01497]